MSKTKVLIAILVLILILASIGFYYVVTHREDTDFKEGIVVPSGIAIYDKEIYDNIVAKTLVLEIQKSPLEKATKQDMNRINDNDRAFSIKALYNAEVPKSGQLATIEVLKDRSFIASKSINGRLQYVKGKFGSYTMDYLTGLYTLQ
jgi:hypothetical protein